MTPLLIWSVAGAIAGGLSACGAIAAKVSSTVTTTGQSAKQQFESQINIALQDLQATKDRLTGEATAKSIYPTGAFTRNIRLRDIALPATVNTYFATVAGGGDPTYNEIALEKNVLYFQRSLNELGFSPTLANFFFASGNAGEPTVRYLDESGQQQFKAADIPDLDGGATIDNTYSWFQALAQTEKPCPAFFYFTGHGAYNPENEDNNWMILWDEAFVSVREMAGWLDPLPADQPFVTMMAQCYAGSFANLIYENGNPEQPVALQTRCGFFATVASRPSVGCTPAVNEADYKDYSSSFFAGLTGRDRIGNPVASADYNQDSQVSYAEAHAFAKVDEETTDWPISTVETWLQKQLSITEVEGAMAKPITEWSAIARPEQQYVIQSLSAKLGFDTALSYDTNYSRNPAPENNTVQEAYHKRLEMELTNVSAEQKVRAEQDAAQIAILDKILRCEAGFWQ
ncbi:MAG: Caspase domain-containing protein [Cyanobacteria bacterium J06598_3]